MSDSSTFGTGHIVLTALVGGMLLGVLYETFTGSPTATSAQPAAAEHGADTLNTLSEAEREAGWRLLFDGTSLDGWRGYQRDSIPGGWTVDEAALHFEGEGRNSTTLITDEEFSNFELRLEWKIAEQGNSGIMYRATEATEDAYRTGPEYQVLDNTVLDSVAGSIHQAGALYGLYAPSEVVARPAGTYNQARIVVNRSHVQHWLNGTKLLEAEMGSDDWSERVAGTKFEDYAGFAESESGHIALQDHGHPVWYRNIKLRPLPPPSESQ